MQEPQDRAPDALDRLYAEARSEVDTLRLARPEEVVLTPDGPPVSEQHARALVITALIGEHRLPMRHFTVAVNYTTVSVDSLADLGAWARALGEDSFETYRVNGKIAAQVEGSVHGVGIHVLHHRETSIPRVIVPATGHHRSPLCSLEPLAGSAVA